MREKHEKSELERTVERGIHGVPKLRPEEKRVYLGEFRERVIIALTPEEIHYEEALEVVEKAIKEEEAFRLIVNSKKVSTEYNRKYMHLARDNGREYKSYNPESKDAMGLVVVSQKAVNRDKIRVELHLLPDKFQRADHKRLCKDHYEELKGIAPDRIEEFQKLNSLDKLLGRQCGVGH